MLEYAKQKLDDVKEVKLIYALVMRITRIYMTVNVLSYILV